MEEVSHAGGGTCGLIEYISESQWWAGFSARMCLVCDAALSSKGMIRVEFFPRAAAVVVFLVAVSVRDGMRLVGAGRRMGCLESKWDSIRSRWGKLGVYRSYTLKRTDALLRRRQLLMYIHHLRQRQLRRHSPVAQ